MHLLSPFLNPFSRRRCAGKCLSGGDWRSKRKKERTKEKSCLLLRGRTMKRTEKNRKNVFLILSWAFWGGGRDSTGRGPRVMIAISTARAAVLRCRRPCGLLSRTNQGVFFATTITQAQYFPLCIFSAAPGKSRGGPRIRTRLSTHAEPQCAERVKKSPRETTDTRDEPHARSRRALRRRPFSPLPLP